MIRFRAGLNPGRSAPLETSLWYDRMNAFFNDDSKFWPSSKVAFRNSNISKEASKSTLKAQMDNPMRIWTSLDRAGTRTVKHSVIWNVVDSETNSCLLFASFSCQSRSQLMLKWTLGKLHKCINVVNEATTPDHYIMKSTHWGLVIWIRQKNVQTKTVARRFVSSLSIFVSIWMFIQLDVCSSA